jgi:FMN phosphatase YigB (HAD superfamily)/membrane-associated phospholipid phosphatase
VGAALAVLAFLILAAAVALHAGNGLDCRLLGLVYENRVRPASWFLTRFTNFGSWYILAPIAVGVVAVLFSRGMRRQAETVALSLTSAVLLNLVLKAFIQRQPPGDLVQLGEAARYSFPSGHTMSSTAFTLSLVVIAWPTRWRRPVLVCAVAGALTMGFSRVYVGVHWPSDVVAGWLMGAAVVAVVSAALQPWRHDGAALEHSADDREGRGTRDPVRVVLFDWGNTLMVDDGQSGPMAEWPRVAAVPGAAEALAALHGRYRLCVATNADDSGAAAVMAALGRVGLARFVDRVFSSRDLGARKPDPAFYAAVLETLRADAAAESPDDAPLHAHQVVMVGDDYANDVAGASAAGLRAIWFDPGRSPAPGGRRADAAEIQSLTDLPDALAH